jgi:ribosome modulation factor
MKRVVTVAYRRDYTRGWRSGQNGVSLDRADANGNSDNDAWLDGYLDAAAGRTKWHIPLCPDHDRCGQG